MFIALVLTIGFVLVVWLAFFKFKWLKWNINWAFLSIVPFLHVLLIFMIGLRFMTPASNNAKVVQHTIQLVPRLSEPTLVTAVLVEQNQPVKKGQLRNSQLANRINLHLALGGSFDDTPAVPRSVTTQAVKGPIQNK